MPRTREPNPFTTGAIGAAAGAVIGGATSVLLTNKSARRKIASKLKDIKDYAQETVMTVGDMTKENGLKRVRLAGVKGGKTRRNLKK